ncbi:MAG: hypothetical protein ACHQVK_04870 [Candidatus Paceibacterales bacterium]
MEVEKEIYTGSLPKIVAELYGSCDKVTYDLYHKLIETNLRKILPPTFLEKYRDKAYTKNELWQDLQAKLPIMMHVVPLRKTPSNMSIYLLIQFRPKAFKFFYELISQWLIPGKRLNVLSTYAGDFSMPEISSNVCLISIGNAAPPETAALSELRS